MIYNTHRHDFTTLESYNGGKYFIFCSDDHEVNSRSKAFIM